ncbi:MAG: CAP domain-containing protein [Gaiellaceae bacterium]
MSRETLRVVALAVVAAAVLAMPAQAAAPAVTSDGSLQRSLLEEINAVRHAHGLAPVRANAALARAAGSHARAMAVHGFFSHSSRDGTAFWKRIARNYTSSGYRTWEVGENLVWSTDLSAGEAVSLWMASPGHKKVLLNGRWREVGLAAVLAPNAPGTFQGRDVTIVTADFGLRR